MTLKLVPDFNGVQHGVHPHNPFQGYFSYRLVCDGNDVGRVRGIFTSDEHARTPDPKGSHVYIDQFEMRDVDKDPVEKIASLREATLKLHPHVRSIGGLRRRDGERRFVNVPFRAQ